MFNSVEHPPKDICRRKKRLGGQRASSVWIVVWPACSTPSIRPGLRVDVSDTPVCRRPPRCAWRRMAGPISGCAPAPSRSVPVQTRGSRAQSCTVICNGCAASGPRQRINCADRLVEFVLIAHSWWATRQSRTGQQRHHGMRGHATRSRDRCGWRCGQTPRSRRPAGLLRAKEMRRSGRRVRPR